jgi:hypothetical protein
MMHRYVLIGSLIVMIISLILLWFLSRDGTITILGSKSKSAVMDIAQPANVQLNQPFTAEVVIDSLGNKVNAAGVYLRFDPQHLRLLDLNTRSSFCQFYPEKKFDNNLGTVSLACGSPHPGIAGTSTLMELSFLPIGVGTTIIKATEESQILVSDGKGNNILSEYPQSPVTIVSSF